MSKEELISELNQLRIIIDVQVGQYKNHRNAAIKKIDLILKKIEE